MRDDAPSTGRRTFIRTATAIAGTGVLGAVATGTVAAASKERHIADAPTVAVSGNRYATTGVDADAPTATVYGNFKCPYTQDFVLDHMAALVRDYVRTGYINLRFRSLAYEPDPSDTSHGISPEYISEDDPAIAKVGLGTWRREHYNYWNFFLNLFRDPPSGGYTAAELQDFAREMEVRNWGWMDWYASADFFDDRLRDTQSAAADYGVAWTPTMEFRGDTTSPHHGRYNNDLYDWLDARL